MKFGKKIGLYFIGNMASKIMTALLIPLYAFYVLPGELGSYDYTQTIMQIAVPIIYVAVWESILKYVLACESQEEKNKYLGTSIFLAVISTVIMIIFVSVFAGFSDIQYAHLVLLMMIFYAYGIIFQYCSRALGKNKIYVCSGIMATIFNFLSILILVVVLRKGLVGLYVSYIIGQAANCLVSFVGLRLWKYISYIKYDKKYVKIMLRFSIPMAVNLASTWIINGAGKIIINNNLGSTANGIYSYANKFGNLVTMVTSVVGMALMEEFYIRMNSNEINTYFQEKCNQICDVILNIFLWVVPFIGIYFHIIGQTDYYVALQYVPLCVMTACITSFATNVGGVFQIKDIMQYAFLTTLAGGIVTILLGLFFIKDYQIMGVVIAQFCGALVMFLSRYFVANRYMKYRLNYLNVFVFIISIIIESFIIVLYENLIVEIILAIINAIALVIYNKKVISEFAIKLKCRI